MLIINNFSIFSAQNTVYKSQNKSKNYTYTTTPITKTLKITFKGKEKNENQIAVIASECVPYSVSGGLGAVTRDMTKAYKTAYPNKDLRLFLPFYNTTKDGAISRNGKLVYEPSKIINEKDNKNLSFEVVDTGIQTNFNYGVRKSKAKLYKIKNPENNVETYMVHIPEFVNLEKQYALDDYSMFEKNVAFSFASVNLLPLMNNDTEKFNPKILHTKDWHTAFANFGTNDKELKKIHELLNANSNFHGKILPLAAALNMFDEDKINRLISNDKFKQELYQLTINNKDILLKNITTKNLNKDINNPDFAKKILINLAENFTKVLYDKNNFYSNIELNNAVRNAFPYINWDENQDFNPTVNAIMETDAWFTISNTHFNELLSDPTFSSLSLYNMLRLNLNKGASVLNKIDVERYNPSNPNQVEYSYDLSDYKKGKAQNKEFIFSQFSQKNILSKNYSKKVINNAENAIVYGYLDPKYQNDPLAINISRFDTNQKGSDIALKAVEDLLNENKKINFVLGLPDIKKLQPQLMENFVKNVINKPENKGRVVLIDAYVPINEYVAAADFSIIPSRSETCGLVGYQSMRMGALPISSPVGSMNDCLVTPEQNYKKAMGFKAPMHFLNSKHPEKILAHTIKEALLLYENEPEQIDRMIKNAMSYNSDWQTAIVEQNDVYEKVLQNKKLNDLSLNDLKNVEDINNLEMLTKDDIHKLKPADVLVVLPHSDDEIFFLPILDYLNKGKSVQIVYSSANEKGHYKKGAPSIGDELRKHREQESLDSLNALGIKTNPIKFNIPDLELSKPEYTEEFTQYLKEVIQQVAPTTVISFGPDGITGNPDHKKLGEITFDCVNWYNKTTGKNAENFQVALTEKDATDLKNIMKYAQTDAFDFVNGTTEENIVKTFDVSQYAEKIKKSLSKHQSQWSESEAKGLSDFYLNNGVKISRLATYPKIQAPRNPWKDRAEHFSNMYGKEFTTNGKEIWFKPENCNTFVNLYLSDNDKNTEHLWLSSNHFDRENIEISPDIPELVLNSIYKIKKIPKFKNVKYVDFVIKDTDSPSKRTKLEIPIEECDMISKIISEFCKDESTTLRLYKKFNPYSQVRISNIN